MKEEKRARENKIEKNEKRAKAKEMRPMVICIVIVSAFRVTVTRGIGGIANLATDIR